jgi:hypothetical protein
MLNVVNPGRARPFLALCELIEVCTCSVDDVDAAAAASYDTLNRKLQGMKTHMTRRDRSIQGKDHAQVSPHMTAVLNRSHGYRSSTEMNIHVYWRNSEPLAFYKSSMY